MIDRALDGATVSLEDIAAAAGISYNTLHAWRTGRRNPSRDNLLKLADAIEHRGGELQSLAAGIRAAADDERES